MENRRPIIISTICFLISLALITGYVQLRRKELTEEFGEEVTVVTATAHIEEYEVIRPEQLTTTKVFKKFKQPQTTEDMNDIIGKATYVPIYAGEQVTFTKLVTQDGKPVLDRQVEKKMRAITLQIAPHTGVGRLIRPGNRVDLMASVNYDSNGTTIFEVKTLVQNVLVLATGKNLQNSVPTRVNRNVLGVLESKFEREKRKDYYSGSLENLSTSRPDDNYTHITLQLSPEDAERVLYISHTFGDSRLYFTLRNSADQTVEKIETALLDDVLGPDSDYGRSKVKPPPITPSKPRFYDNKGGQAVPVY